MSDNIQTKTTGRLTPCLQRIDETTYLVEVHFSATSTQSIKDKLKRVIFHDIEHGKQGKPKKFVALHLLCQINNFSHHNRKFFPNLDDIRCEREERK